MGVCSSPVLMLSDRTSALNTLVPISPPTRVSVKRSLFGPVDHEKVNKYLQDKMEQVEEQQKKRWNFNFAEDEPLEGPYKWERLKPMPRNPSSLVPAEEAPSASSAPAPSVPAKSVVTTTASSSSANKSPTKVTKRRGKRSPRKLIWNNRNKNTQPSITHFMEKSKRLPKMNDQ